MTEWLDNNNQPRWAPGQGKHRMSPNEWNPSMDPESLGMNCHGPWPCLPCNWTVVITVLCWGQKPWWTPKDTPQVKGKVPRFDRQNSGLPSEDLCSFLPWSLCVRLGQRLISLNFFIGKRGSYFSSSSRTFLWLMFSTVISISESINNLPSGCVVA